VPPLFPSRPFSSSFSSYSVHGVKFVFLTFSAVKIYLILIYFEVSFSLSMMIPKQAEIEVPIYSSNIMPI